MHGKLRGRVRIKAQIHDSIPFQYRAQADADAVLALMNTSVEVRGADGVKRTMKIPSDMKCGEVRWSELA